MSLSLPKEERGARARALERMVSSSRVEAIPNIVTERTALPTDVPKDHEQLPKIQYIVVERPGTPATRDMGEGLVIQILSNRAAEGSKKDTSLITTGKTESKKSTTRNLVSASLPKLGLVNPYARLSARNNTSPKPLPPIRPRGGKNKRKTQKRKPKKHTAKKHKK